MSVLETTDDDAGETYTPSAVGAVERPARRDPVAFGDLLLDNELKVGEELSIEGEAWEEMDVQIVEVVEADDKVAALVRFSGRGKGSGVEVEGGVDTHVWTIRDGTVVAVTMYQGTTDALREFDL